MSSMRQYEGFQTLMTEYRKSKNQSQDALARKLGISERTYGRWERGDGGFGRNELVNLARVTRIPVEVLLRLSFGYPTLYNVDTHRYSTCAFDHDFVNEKVLRERLLSTNWEGQVQSLGPGSPYAETVATFFRPAFPNALHSSQATIRAAADMAPNLNLIVLDPFEVYSGHAMCFPLRDKAYEDLASEKLKEADVAPEHLEPLSRSGPAHLHLYGLFATCSTHMYSLLRRFVVNLVLKGSPGDLKDTTLSMFTASRDGKEVATKLGLETRYIAFDLFNQNPTEIPGHFFAARLEDLDWFWSYRESLLTSPV
jgi:transcriptional regulator with XRE-family HTH domain